MSRENKFWIISTFIAIVTLIVEIVFVVLGNGLGAGLCPVFGIMLCGLFRFVAELGGGEE